MRHSATQHPVSRGGAPSAVSLAGVARRLAHAAHGVPKYLAIRDAFAQSVSSNELPSGARLPAETDTALALGASLGTVQRALALLVRDGLVVRQQGQGSFVAASARAMESPLHCRFVNDAGDGYLPVYTDVIDRRAETGTGPWSEHLGASGLLRIDRILSIGGELRVFSRFYVSGAHLPQFKTLSVKALNGENFKSIIWRASGLPVGRVSQFLSHAVLAGDIARHVRVKSGTAGLFLQACAYGGNDEAVYYQELHIPPTQRKLHLARDGRDAGLAA